MEKPADTQFPILSVLERRWSPRSFSDRPVESSKLKQLFEAARWSASSFNEQPWRFVVATRDQPEAYQKAFDCLVEGNQGWAKLAPVLGFTFAKRTFTKNGHDNRVAQHDVGAAMAQLSAQAAAVDLFVHQMGGIHLDKIVTDYEVPDDFEPVAGFAIGYSGEPGQLTVDWMREAETAPRQRMPLTELVFGETFGQTASLFA